jgi:hypothetical protein
VFVLAGLWRSKIDLSIAGWGLGGAQRIEDHRIGGWRAVDAGAFQCDEIR